MNAHDPPDGITIRPEPPGGALRHDRDGGIRRMLENLSWTPPTLAGTTLYVRDRKTIAAFALGKQ